MAKNKKENRGGKRAGAGRPKLSDGETKIQIDLYFKEKDVEILGGKESVKELLIKKFEISLKKSL